MKNKPDIRFDGFTDAWELRELENVVNFFNQKRVPIDAELRSEGIYPYYGATGIIDYVDNFIFDGEYVLLAEDGANILTRNSPIAYITRGKFWLNNHAHIMRMIKGNNQFLLQILEKQNYIPLNTGTAQPKLNSQTIRKMQLIIPQEDEQQQIGTFFKELDNLITLHQRELENYKLLKKGFLQKLFPSNGDTNPSIRFDGFTDAWEQRRLGELAQSYVGGGTPSTKNEKYWNGEIPWIQSSDLLLDDVHSVNYTKKISKKALENSAAKLIPAGSLAIVTRVGVGKLALVPFDYSTSQDFISFVTLKANPVYLQYVIYLLLNKVKHSLQGTSIKGVTNKELLSSVIKLPKYEEQTKIGLFFHSLDNLITLHQRELEKYKELKKGFLQKMFV